MLTELSDADYDKLQKEYDNLLNSHDELKIKINKSNIELTNMSSLQVINVTNRLSQ